MNASSLGASLLYLLSCAVMVKPLEFLKGEHHAPDVLQDVKKMETYCTAAHLSRMSRNEQKTPSSRSSKVQKHGFKCRKPAETSSQSEQLSTCSRAELSRKRAEIQQVWRRIRRVRQVRRCLSSRTIELVQKVGQLCSAIVLLCSLSCACCVQLFLSTVPLRAPGWRVPGLNVDT